MAEDDRTDPGTASTVLCALRDLLALGATRGGGTVRTWVD
ncbi:hypothetical protein SYYSPA8_11600 [Streptomyces yaizuensis]|uniref:Uncharacterized protein n=1 Tax=Streptomyces yaizuensis TaxID=2989713 RepID=A0ABQ5NX49_9ACTN|nr:hypothetical protein SYYSPA8_11600 [Streptomyces sp. YSPA8]